MSYIAKKRHIRQEPMNAPMTAVTVGIDVGSQETKVVLGPSASCEIVRSSVGGHTTPTAISFSDEKRMIGETANLKGKHTVIEFNRLLNVSPDDPFMPFYNIKPTEKGGNKLVIGTEETTTTLDVQNVLAGFLGKIRNNVKATLDRLGMSDSPIGYVLALPPGSTREERDAFRDAAYAAGLGQEEVKVVSSTSCTAAAYKRKFPNVESKKVVLIVDMGHTQTTVSVIQLDKNEETDVDSSNPVEESSTPVKILSSVSTNTLGAGSVDVKLWQHFCDTVPALANLSPSSRGGHRLLDACQRLKQLVSQLPDAKVTGENINDVDVTIAINRAMLSELCESEMQRLTKLLDTALTDAGVSADDLSSVEILGGGGRIPLVKATVLNALDNKLASSHSLDDTSVALGAGVIGHGDPNAWATVDPFWREELNAETKEYREQLLKQEQQMAARDDEMRQKDSIRNKLEEHVLELRSAQHSKHGVLLPKEELNTHLDATDDWLFSDECSNATLHDMEDKLSSVLAKSNELAKEYLDATQKEKDEMDKEMEKEAALAQAERDAAGSDEEEDAHDNRRLPKKRRMEIVLKNKKEANELFADGNYRHAAARYAKALSHCSKFVDLSPDDKDEVSQVMLALNLNLALAYSKLEMPDQALRVANDTLEIDPDNIKALYRRASIFYDKKKWEDANIDLQKAASLAPDDKAIKKLQQRVDAMVKKQKAKEKKMAQKMFG